jgi:hypothetical protein
MDQQPLNDAQFELVLRYNPQPGEEVGREIEQDVLAQIFIDIRKKFGNHKIHGPPGEGSWEGLVEPSMRVEVAVPAERLPELEAFVYEIGERLGQKEMYFNQGTPCVKLLKIKHPSATKSSEGGK